MDIEIKKTHIRRGRKNSVESCPIAIAIRESLGVENIRVERTRVKIGKKTFCLPTFAQKFIDAFDENKSSVNPFTLTL